MSQTFRALSALLLSAALLISGNGLQATLLSVRGELEQFPVALIGFFMSAYYVGFIVGCRVAPVIVRRVGHIRAFTALASVASAAALAHALAVEAVFWIFLRVVSGFALAGLYMIIESWINETVSNQTRGRVLSVYRIIDLTALTAGQALLAVGDPQSFALFAVVSIIISFALVPVALTTAIAPKPIDAVDLDFSNLFRTSPVAAAGCFAAGLANSAFWALGPVYAQRLGFEIAAVAGFMSAVIIGGALSQWPVGLASDRLDRRIVLAATAAACALTSLFMTQLATAPLWMLVAGGVGFGVFALPVYGLAIAHGNDRAERKEYVSLNATLLFLFGSGAVMGPALGSLAVTLGGAPFLFLHIAVVYAALTGFSIVRIVQRGAPAPEDREDFAAVPRSTPAVFDLDPRTQPAAAAPAPAQEREKETQGP